MSRRKAFSSTNDMPSRGQVEVPRPALRAAIFQPARLLMILALLASAFAVYAGVRQFQFVDFDDDVYVTQNPTVRRGLSAEGAAWALTSTHGANWHPLTWFSHMLDIQWFGMEAGGHHITSVLLHLLNSLLVLWVLCAMTSSFWPSLLTAALFALHPVHVESVAWIAERKDVLGGTFWFLTLGLYRRYTLSPTWRRYTLVAVSLALGLMAKPMLVTLPLVLLLLDFWPLRRLQRALSDGNSPIRALRALLREKLPLICLSAASCVVTFLAQKSGGAVQTLESIPVDARLANAVISYVRYLAMAIWPTHLAVFYPYPEGIAWGLVAASLCLLAGLTAAVCKLAPSLPYLVTGWLWFLGTLVPVIGVVQVGDQALADRYAYIPFVGLYIALAWCVNDLCSRRSATGVAAATACVAALLALAVVARQQTEYWRDSGSLFERAIGAVPDNYLAHNNLGFYLTRRGRLDAAIAHYKEALRIRPRYPQSLGNLGATLAAKGSGREAIDYYRRALELKPNFAEAHANLGTELAKQGRLEDADTHLSAALRVRPAYFKARHTLGLLYLKQGRFAEAVGQLEAAARLEPDNGDARANLGAALSAAGRRQEAIAEYEHSLKLNPDSVSAHNNLGAALAALGNMDGAIREFNAAVRLAPDSPDAHFNLARAYRAAGRREEAETEYEILKGLQPALADSLRQSFSGVRR